MHRPDDAPTVTTSGSNDYATFRRVLRRASPQLARPLPWIAHPDPWAVLVSEFMLQQTQTSRVVEPWRRFLTTFPTPTACADAPLSAVLRLWGGLGYHRRAKALHEAARRIRDQHDGAVPREVRDLRSLPGVGEYTANAVASFAFAAPVAVLDTNVGRVLARALVNRTLRPAEARAIAQGLLPRRDVASFNQAMLDLGASYCKSSPLCAACPVAKACRWRLEGGADPAPRSAGVSRPQSTFEGSDRQARGRVLAALRTSDLTNAQLRSRLDDVEAGRYQVILAGLVNDGLVERSDRVVRLAGD
jgi:A/G-specific adenine glycosylase